MTDFLLAGRMGAMKWCASIFLAVCLTSGYFSQSLGFTFTSTPAFQPAAGEDRTLIIISDLHLGPGMKPDGQDWYPQEDFRWPKALKAFLDKISQEGKGKVDLLIAGDFLDMWQPPSDIQCRDDNANLGYTVPQMNKIAAAIVQGHPQVFECLRSFARQGQNRLHLIPGNHDAALLIQEVWEPVAEALATGGGRVNFQASGNWVSADGKIVVEHGHQIGHEANRYRDWPNIVRRENGEEFVIRPWGELFLQKLLNQEEDTSNIIDNFAPDGDGIWCLMKARGFQGSAIDIARFLDFNLFQTSLAQKAGFLGKNLSPGAKPEWDLAKARNLGHRLYLAALPKDDPFRQQLLENTDKAKEIIRQLDLLVVDAGQFPDENVKMLCDKAVDQGNAVCIKTLGGMLEKLVPKERIFSAHLIRKKKEFPELRYLIFGHTHIPDGPLSVKDKDREIGQVLNSGAFQRIIDKKGFFDIIAEKEVSTGKKVSISDGLEQIKVEEIRPDYTFIRVSYQAGGFEKPKLCRWVMKETDTSGQEITY
jgi:UDP-2,3-diacylglucosamine pyrophosphatase LpxH